MTIMYCTYLLFQEINTIKKEIGACWSYLDSAKISITTWGKPVGEVLQVHQEKHDEYFSL